MRIPPRKCHRQTQAVLPDEAKWGLMHFPHLLYTVTIRIVNMNNSKIGFIGGGGDTTNVSVLPNIFHSCCYCLGELTCRCNVV
jgi:hypothetical protein